MIRLEGYFYDGVRPVAVAATLFVDGPAAALSAGALEERFTAARLTVSPRIGSAGRFISLPSGGQFHCTDQPALDELPQESPSEGPVAWLEDRWGVALACVVVSVCLLLAGYVFGLPAAATRIASRVPIETEQTLGRQAVEWLDGKGMFTPTRLDRNTQRAITKGFARLCGDLPLKKHLHLEFRAAVFGANAFAFPGGTIIVTDDLVIAAASRDEVLAVLAHEIGHVEQRHALRSLLQGSAVAIAVATVTADAASLSTIVAGFPVLLAQTKYSRAFEADADEYAFRLLKQKGRSPASFATLLERLAKEHKQDERAFAYVSTHPITADRMKRARQAAKE